MNDLTNLIIVEDITILVSPLIVLGFSKAVPELWSGKGLLLR